MGLTTLRAKLTASCAILGTVFGIFAMYFFPSTALNYAEQLELARVQSLARTLAKAATSSLEFADDLALREIVDSIGDEPDGRFSAIVAGDGRQVVAFTATLSDKPDFASYATRAIQGQLLTDTPELLVLAHPIKGSIGAGGFFILGVSRDIMKVMRVRIRGLTYLFAALIVAGASALGWVIGLFIARPAVELARTSRQIVETGDLTVDFGHGSQDEIGEIGRAFRELIAAQRELLSGVRDLSGSVQTTSEQVEHAGTQLDEMSSAAAKRIEGAQRNADLTRSALAQLTQRTDDLEAAMGDAQGASAHVGDIARIVAGKVADASRVGEQNQSALAQVLGRLRGAQQAADSLSDLVKAGQGTLDEMQDSIGRVRNNAQHAAQAGEMVALQADEGEVAMSRTLDDLEGIRRQSKVAALALGELVARIDDVTDVVTVIDEVAAQTNLLSLNASIIASQAGEQGRAFSVVAAEIKSLSASTRDHTQRISDIVTNVKREFANVRIAMQTGLQNAEQGAERGRHTAAAFSNIALAATDSRDRLRSIAHDTDQQATLSTRVGSAISDLAKNVQLFGAEQRAVLEATGHVREYVEEVVRTTLDVQRASSDQLEATAQIDEAVGRVRMVSRALDDAQKRQVQAHSELLAALSTLSGFASDQRHIAASLTHAIGELKERVGALRGGVERYRV